MNTFEYTNEPSVNPTQLVKRSSAVKAVCAGLTVVVIAVSAYVQLANDNVITQEELIAAQKEVIAKQAELIAAQEAAIKVERAKGVIDKAEDNIRSLVAYVTN